MQLITLFFSNPILFFALVIPLLYSIIAHEVAHGVVALFFGDDTARRYGRLTLNPLSHLDPMGTLMLFLVGFGWARPVPVDFGRLRGGRVGFICVALAGIVTNILLATVSVMLLQMPGIGDNPFLTLVLSVFIRINIILGAFNLIPVPPLDGSKVLLGILPPEGQRSLIKLEPYGFFIIVLLLFSGLLEPVINLIQNLILILIFFLLHFAR
ncbi:MAG: site-2 protease family protein [Candidatus Omnitrophica bacterium]|nr:site-2 protease family protein [Candidatus Omnitrophota bacterium]